jgi:hypothetical protein
MTQAELLEGTALDDYLEALDHKAPESISMERAPLPQYTGIAVFEFPGIEESVPKARGTIAALTREYVEGKYVPHAPRIRAENWSNKDDVVEIARRFISDGVTNALEYGETRGGIIPVGIGVTPDGGLIYAIGDNTPHTGLTQQNAAHGNGIKIMIDGMHRAGIATPAAMERGGRQAPYRAAKAVWGVREPETVSVPTPRSSAPTGKRRP